ncbi:MAG: hypothetical protein HYV67_03970 [Candidatus Taylorbacteria bacterium]|nr:hypothetical protein [Candidatus Taylorbacteria bacterium]
MLAVFLAVFALSAVEGTEFRVTTKRGYGCASVAVRTEKRAIKNDKLIVLFSETETAKQNQKFPFHFFFRFAAEESARASPSPRLLLLTGAVHLLDILFRFAHKISQKVLRKCPTLSYPRKIVAGRIISDFALCPSVALCEGGFWICVSDLVK